MDISDIAKLNKSLGESNLNSKENQDDEKIKEAFKSIFVEQMIGQMMKTGSVVSGVEGLQKELVEEQVKESLGQYFMDSSGIRWNEILGLTKADGKENGKD